MNPRKYPGPPVTDAMHHSMKSESERTPCGSTRRRVSMGPSPVDVGLRELDFGKARSWPKAGPGTTDESKASLGSRCTDPPYAFDFSRGFSSQNRMSMSEYIPLAVTRCS